MKKKNTSTVGQSQSRSVTVGSRLGHLALALAPSAQPVGSRALQALSVKLAGTFSRTLHHQHRSLPLEQVLGVLRCRFRRQWGYTEVVGQWVWVHVSPELQYLERAWLFELGFHYSPRRRAWQHPCGVPSSPSREPFVKYFPAESATQSPEFAPHF